MFQVFAASNMSLTSVVLVIRHAENLKCPSFSWVIQFIGVDHINDYWTANFEALIIWPELRKSTFSSKALVICLPSSLRRSCNRNRTSRARRELGHGIIVRWKTDRAECEHLPMTIQNNSSVGICTPECSIRCRVYCPWYSMTVVAIFRLCTISKFQKVQDEWNRKKLT